jgi:hypothetical protein
MSALTAGAWWPRASVAAAPRLSARRARTFRTLTRTLRDAPDPRFGAVGSVRAYRRFARWYARQDVATRIRADAILDGVGAHGVPAPGRLARHAAHCSGAAAARRRAALAAAVDLVALVCEPPPAEDERPAAPALGLRP